MPGISHKGSFQATETASSEAVGLAEPQRPPQAARPGGPGPGKAGSRLAEPGGQRSARKPPGRDGARRSGREARQRPGRSGAPDVLPRAHLAPPVGFAAGCVLLGEIRGPSETGAQGQRRGEPEGRAREPTLLLPTASALRPGRGEKGAGPRARPGAPRVRRDLPASPCGPRQPPAASRAHSLASPAGSAETRGVPLMPPPKPRAAKTLGRRDPGSPACELKAEDPHSGLLLRKRRQRAGPAWWPRVYFVSALRAHATRGEVPRATPRPQMLGGRLSPALLESPRRHSGSTRNGLRSKQFPTHSSLQTVTMRPTRLTLRPARPPEVAAAAFPPPRRPAVPQGLPGRSRPAPGGRSARLAASSLRPAARSGGAGRLILIETYLKIFHIAETCRETYFVGGQLLPRCRPWAAGTLAGEGSSFNTMVHPEYSDFALGGDAK
uniref:translation initiation factor IF-2-like n=1 Tax=Nyctereutes procyonoides TaxID=34880 RepID=UPI00244512A4|nr:translation initiation factor IF-2-like [Nyctereutes procyonoides]